MSICVCAQVRVVFMCIHSIHLITIAKYLLNVYYAPDTVLEAWDTTVDKMKILALYNLTFDGDFVCLAGMDMWLCV